MAASYIRRIPVFLRMTDFGADEVTFRNQPVGERAFIVRNQPVILDICLFHDANSAEIMTKAELERIGCHVWTLNISKNHALMYPVFIQPDYADTENPPITVSENGVISVRLDITDTQESADAISGMQADMWEAELAGFGEDDTALEHPSFVFQWSIGYVNRVASENADAPGLLEATYYTKEQVNELLRQIAPEGTWGHIIGDITDQEDLIAHLEEKADKATTLGGYGITDAYTKTEIDSKVASVYRYKGSVNEYSDLPTEDQQVGDVYNVVTADATHDIKAGDNVAWNGEKWDVLAGEIDLSGYIQKAEKGEPNGVPTLDGNGKVPMSQMPILQLDSPPTTSTVGSVGQLAVWHDFNNSKDHLYHLCFVSEGDSATLYHWEECVLLGSDGKIASNLLRIPIAGFSPYDNPDVIGGFKLQANNNYGLTLNTASGNLVIASATSLVIDNRTSAYRPIVPSNLDYAVRSVLPNVTEIPAATSDYSLVDSSATTLNHSHTFSHSPSSVPTYRLPQVTDTTISHYIELTVDFTNVQTYSFLDNAGEPIVPLFTPAIAAGDVYTFKCEYSAIKGAWLIYPQKQGAVADDFVMRGEVGAANGVPSLDSNALVPSTQLPIAQTSARGAVSGYALMGIGVRNDGVLYPTNISDANILNRDSYKIVTTALLNKVVTAALTDSNHITLTDAQKATAQSVFGVGGPITAIPAATSEYTLSYGRFSHVPELASTYVLPAVADGSITNDIVLSIKFSASVLTYEFQDSAGNTLVPLPLNGDIEAGIVVTFLCRYNPLLAQWVIYPVMDGKEVTP